MNKRLFIILFLLCSFTSAHAQTAGSYYVAARGMYSAPIGSLGDWFKPATGVQIAFGTRSESDLTWEFNAEMMTYSKPNTGKLYYPDLDLKLELFGLGAQVDYAITTQSMVTPYVTAGAAFYRWLGTRGRHALDSAQTQIVWELKQNDWSAGFNAGIGVNVAVTSALSIDASARYHIVNGELWPALALRLENVSGFQSLRTSVGLKYEFEF
ncbi:MAG: outer membrane protein [Acidobacteriota bacterium]